MLIGELAKKSGFSRDTIRFYEKSGLIELDKESRFENNYKDYSTRILHRLEVIRKIKDMGFTLVEIKAMIDLFEAGLLEQERGKKYIQKKINRIDQKIEELKNIRSALSDIVNTPKGECRIKNILEELNN